MIDHFASSYKFSDLENESGPLAMRVQMCARRKRLSAEDSRDVVSDVAVGWIEYERNNKGRSPNDAIFWTIVHRRICDVHRRRMRGPLNAKAATLVNIVAREAVAKADDCKPTRKSRQAIRNVMEKLRAPQRELVDRLLNGETCTEICDRLGITRQALRLRIRRIVVIVN